MLYVKMFNFIWFLASVLLCSVQSQSDCNFRIKEYIKFEIFQKGFRVLLLDQPGIEVFRFYGRVNKSITYTEHGEFSDKEAEKQGTYWVFQDNTTKLNIGDKIHYRVFVIRNNLGFRIDDEIYTVNEISERGPLKTNSKTNYVSDDVWRYKHESSNKKFDINIRSGFDQGEIIPKVETSICCQLYLNVSYRIIDLAEENIKLQNENRILAELLQRDEHNSKTLKIFGHYSSKLYPTSKMFVQDLIEAKLGLKDVKVEEAKAIQDGVSFKVKNLRDKVKVILAAKKRLEGSNYELNW